MSTTLDDVLCVMLQSSIIPTDIVYTASEAHCLLDASHHQSMTLQGKQRNLKKRKNIPLPNTGIVKDASL